MSVNEPLHDPVELLGELNAVIREQELLRQRMVALQAKYRSLESFAEAGGFDKPGRYEFLPEEFGRVNLDAATARLDDAADAMSGPERWLRLAREYAAKVREYPRPDRSEADSMGGLDAWSNALSNALDTYRRVSTDRGEAEGRSL
ncbi:hypothetical protein [Nocardia bovistercoris]|uniref:Uncharacterized protein n=1 Tax=Nocardia bovistercoris TaxID=2785916 RepID=A0A931IAY8_9NOCA|nr:hypothetical protein [Nocardia bovistercoris]MBH0777271.1 hypothetical protein [Nocardia bovistercoris]